MKSPISLTIQESPETKARQALQHIQKWFEIYHPGMNTATKARLIVECLIEITEERRIISMN